MKSHWKPINAIRPRTPEPQPLLIIGGASRQDKSTRNSEDLLRNKFIILLVTISGVMLCGGFLLLILMS